VIAATEQDGGDHAGTDHDSRADRDESAAAAPVRRRRVRDHDRASISRRPVGRLAE